MADRVSASITLGGVVSAAEFEILVQFIADENLSTDWDGPWFTPEDVEPGKPLKLKAGDVANGEFDELEAWCVARALPFVRWSNVYPGRRNAERVVFTGLGEPQSYRVDEGDSVVTGRGRLEALADLPAILAWFDAAEFEVPPLIILPGDGPATIARLNEAFRRQSRADWVITAGVHALGEAFVARAVGVVRAFDKFGADNDPHGERDFGAFALDGARLFWKIDYYDLALEAGSPDPADPAVTRRLMTVLLAEEY